jgi:hypothetical protein
MSEQKFDELLAIHLHRGSTGAWFVVVKERCSITGRVRTRNAMRHGGRLEFDPSGEQYLLFDEHT